MSIATGIVRCGKIVVEQLALAEGTLVTVIADDEQPAVKLPPARWNANCSKPSTKRTAMKRGQVLSSWKA